MTVISARKLHRETGAILEEVANGKVFRIMKNGKVIGTLQPTTRTLDRSWKRTMARVWAAQKKVSRTTRNPVLQERERRRR